MIRLWRKLMGQCVVCGRPSRPYRSLYCSTNCAWWDYGDRSSKLRGRRDAFVVKHNRDHYDKRPER